MKNCKGEREKETDRERQAGRQKEIERDRDRDREGESERESERTLERRCFLLVVARYNIRLTFVRGKVCLRPFNAELC